MAPVDPAPWPPRWITQRKKRDLFCTCLLLTQVKKSVSTGSWCWCSGCLSATDKQSNTQALYTATDWESESITIQHVSGLCVRLTFHGFKTLKRDKAEGFLSVRWSLPGSYGRQRWQSRSHLWEFSSDKITRNWDWGDSLMFFFNANIDLLVLNTHSSIY